MKLKPRIGDYAVQPQECPAWVVQIPDGDGSADIGYAVSAEDAYELAKSHGVDEAVELYSRLDYCEWHVGF